MPASLNPAITTNDLRSGAKSYQRDKSHKSKWAKGGVTKGKKCPANADLFAHDCVCGQCHIKPLGAWEHNAGQIRQKQISKKHLSGQASTLARKAFRNDVVDAVDGPLAGISDPSSDEDINDASAAPLPAEADFMYSYDKTSGPGRGENVLSTAITAALTRFENTETEKLVNKEYDVIDEAKEGYTADEDDDDFEMIEHSHLK